MSSDCGQCVLSVLYYNTHYTPIVLRIAHIKCEGFGDTAWLRNSGTYNSYDMTAVRLLDYRERPKL